MSGGRDFAANSRSMPPGRRERDRDAVDRVRRDRHDAARLERAHRLGAAGRVVRDPPRHARHQRSGRRSTATRGSPPRSSSIVARPAGQALAQRARASPPPGRRRSRGAPRRRRPAPPAAARRSRSITREAVGPAVEGDGAARTRPPSGASAPRRSGRTAGSRGRGPRGRASSPGSRSAFTNVIRSPTACATAFSRASWSASSRRVGRRDVAPRRPSSAAGAARPTVTATAPLPTPTSTTRSGGEPAGRGAPMSRRTISSSASSTSFSVSGRGISARGSTPKARPWNSLTPRM